MAYGLHSNHPMIDTSTAAAFWAEAEPKSDRRRGKDIRKSIDSIQHKLNIIRYNAGLIHSLSEEDYLHHRFRFLNPNKPNESMASYQNRCLFLMENEAEYLMFLTLFIESFAAASFSLFDVSAHLLKDIFELPFQDAKGRNKSVSYVNALQESKLIHGYASLHAFLNQYKPGEANSVTWIKPLKEVRNRTTHRPITDVCRFPVQSDDGNLYYDAPTMYGFLLYDDIFIGTTTSDEKLKVFVENCFDGIEQFVEDLYTQLAAVIRSSPSLPL